MGKVFPLCALRREPTLTEVPSGTPLTCGECIRLDARERFGRAVVPHQIGAEDEREAARSDT